MTPTNSASGTESDRGGVTYCPAERSKISMRLVGIEVEIETAEEEKEEEDHEEDNAEKEVDEEEGESEALVVT